ncbi:glycosyl hydrolase family 95 catalytic domain-containing protein [Nonomuraea sp. JJY05]|uniref:glycoside hydrolase family 95 protein n=1 Tax=Nonomuraea sp. JJY05 TaxID=3350255 RepID=UPI00373F62A0
MTTRHLLRLHAPAAHFHDGFPLGNGRLGAMAYGRPEVERFDLNLDTFWSGGPLPPEQGPSPAALLPELRAAIAASDFERADRLGRRMQSSGWTQAYQPLGFIEWRHTSGGEPSGYRRELDLARAVTTVSHDGGQLISFVSAPASVLVASARGPLELPAFTSPHPVEVIRDGEWLTITGRAPANVLPDYVDREPAVVYGADAPDRDGTVAAGMGFAVVIAVQSTGSGEVRMVAAAADGFRGHAVRPSADTAELARQARRQVEAALSRSTAELLAEHEADHRGYFDRVDLSLPDERAELYYHFGRYLLISSSRPGTQPANLQGIWNADVRPGWSSNYTTNINLPMNYWPAEPAGLPELHQPLFELIGGLLDTGQDAARHYYGAAGATTHHNTDLWRFSAPVNGDPQWANWSSGLLWLTAHLWDHLEYGGAPELLLPALRSATSFALDLLVPDAHGKLVMSPSTSPEHHFLTEAGNPAAISAGAAMDQELVREVLTRYCSLADDELAVRAGKALPQLRPVAIDGELLEWYDRRPSQEPGHRHLSHLYGLYPGTRITESGTPDDFEAVRQALATRLHHGSGHTGWSQAWILCLAARLRDPELAERSIAILLDELGSVSLLDLHPHGGRPSGYIFQIDGNFGAVAGMTELLVQSHEGAVSLLKTLPGSWDTGSVRGIRCRGGHTASVAWSAGMLTSAAITAGSDGRLVVEVPGDTPPLTVTCGERAVPAREVSGALAGRRRMTWDATALTRYTLVPEGSL